MRDPPGTSRNWTIDLANNEFWDGRGNYRGAQPGPKWDRLPNRPASDALPFGVSYETFRTPGPRVQIDFTGDPTDRSPRTRATRTGGAGTPRSPTRSSTSTPPSPAVTP